MCPDDRLVFTEKLEATLLLPPVAPLRWQMEGRFAAVIWLEVEPGPMGCIRALWLILQGRFKCTGLLFHSFRLKLYRFVPL